MSKCGTFRLLLCLAQGFSKVSIGVLDETVEESNEVIWIAICYQELSERRCKNSTIPVVSGAIQEIREKSHNPLESSLILWRQSPHCRGEVFVKVGWE